MSGAALFYNYSYLFASQIDALPRGPAMQLATFTSEDVNPYFFTGRLQQPFKVSRLLQGLVHLVRTRFFMPTLPVGADPIITAHEDFLRFEIFSGCCSVYARVDLPPAAIDGRTLGQGTTNVDFNPALVAALGRVRQTDELDVSVGADEFLLESQAGRTVEKKVQLPIRWLKGLVAVTEYAGRIELRQELKRAQATKFLRGLPRTQDHKAHWWVQRSGQSVRVSQRPTKGAVQVGGLNRLRVLEDLVRFADRLRIYGHDDIDASGWELDCGDARFTLLMTHDVWRGFSGEGQALQTLAKETPKKVVDRTRACLSWQPVLEPDTLATRLLGSDEIHRGLGVLATQGQVGFDTSTGAYFHRELPFDLELVNSLQPRLRSARKLVDEGCVRGAAGRSNVFEITSGNTVHTVKKDGEDTRCTCPWYGKHRNRRGPCKHILAVQIAESPEGTTDGSG